MGLGYNTIDLMMVLVALVIIFITLRTRKHIVVIGQSPLDGDVASEEPETAY